MYFQYRHNLFGTSPETICLPFQAILGIDGILTACIVAVALRNTVNRVIALVCVCDGFDQVVQAGTDTMLEALSLTHLTEAIIDWSRTMRSISTMQQCGKAGLCTMIQNSLVGCNGCSNDSAGEGQKKDCDFGHICCHDLNVRMSDKTFWFYSHTKRVAECGCLPSP
jgi:hypothetical protein